MANEDMGSELRRLRSITGMSQAGFAEALGVSRGVIAQIERGRTAPAAGLLERAENLAAGAEGPGARDGAAASRTESAAEETDRETSADSRDGPDASAETLLGSAETESSADIDRELARLSEAVEILTREIRTGGGHLPHPLDSSRFRELEAHRSSGILTKAAAAAAIVYGSAGALVLTGLLARHGLQPVLSLMGSFAADAGRWLMDLVPLV